MHHPEKAYHVPATVLVDALIGALGFFFCGGALASALALVDPSFVQTPRPNASWATPPSAWPWRCARSAPCAGPSPGAERAPSLSLPKDRPIPGPVSSFGRPYVRPSSPRRRPCSPTGGGGCPPVQDQDAPPIKVTPCSLPSPPAPR